MHRLTTVQKLPISLDEAWEFFSRPENLIKITPKDMALIPVSEIPEKMYSGVFIEYKVKPVLGIWLTWVTEITHIENRKYFIDEQRVGPYKIWHHEHHFREIEGGTEMTDYLWYEMPFGLFGKIANALYVSNKVKSIFEYRERKLIEVFGKMPTRTPNS